MQQQNRKPTFSLYFLPAMHSGAIQYGDPTIDSCESNLSNKNTVIPN